ncbi:MAG: hypothetical protein H0V82_06330 [Candidatus Protochlamydia sp.]|nr:hypothetical protein [Candidatus Protochlamydia sp.]
MQINKYAENFNYEFFDLVKEDSSPIKKYLNLLDSFNNQLEDLRCKKRNLVYDWRNKHYYNEKSKIREDKYEILVKITELKKTFLVFKVSDYVENRLNLPEWVYLGKNSQIDCEKLRKIANKDTQLIHQKAIEIITKSALTLLCAHHYDAEFSLNELQVPTDILKEILLSSFGNVDLMTFKKFEASLKEDIKFLFKKG